MYPFEHSEIFFLTLQATWHIYFWSFCLRMPDASIFYLNMLIVMPKSYFWGCESLQTPLTGHFVVQTCETNNPSEKLQPKRRINIYVIMNQSGKVLPQIPAFWFVQWSNRSADVILDQSKKCYLRAWDQSDFGVPNHGQSDRCKLWVSYVQEWRSSGLLTSHQTTV